MILITTMNRTTIPHLVALLALVACAPRSAAAADAVPPEAGQAIYQSLCLECHGEMGKGVSGKAKEPLRGDESLSRLTRIIHKTMPDDHPDRCVDDDAAKVAAFIHGEFYAPTSRLRRQTARIELAHLTVRQFEESIADLVGSFAGAVRVDERRGLPGEYFASRNHSGNKRAFRRTDPVIDFDFGEATPDAERITTNEFAMRWQGSVIAPDTGDYEFVVRSQNGFRLWVNDPAEPLIDAWVNSGSEATDHQATLRLLGGRAYPLRLDYFKYKDKTASIRLEWKAPHGVREVLPERCLSPAGGPATFVITTPLPPDDSSVGYARGTLVSLAWDEAVTFAAIETANHVSDHLDRLAGTKSDAGDRPDKLKSFAVTFAGRAFRRPLTDAERELFIGRRFEQTPDPAAAVKRCVLRVLKSPRFLYPGLEPPPIDLHGVATRLALALWDSLPDQALRDAVERGKLETPPQIESQAQRLLTDPRTREKLRGFLHHWLQLDHVESLAKDAGLFPGFDAALIADLRTSLNLFLDEVVWSEGSDYRRLLLANDLFLNASLAKFYGLEWQGGTGFERVALDAGHRAGVITHPYLLAAFAYPRSTSPIHRGVFLTRNIVGRGLNPPPMAVAFNDAEFDPNLTMREKVAELTRPQACQTCHSFINPLGFSLEHFDAVGRYRTTDNERPIDATGDYETVSGELIHLTRARDVAEYAARSNETRDAFIEQLFHHTVKQPLRAYGEDVAARLRESFQRSGGNIQKLLVEIAVIAARPPSASHSHPDQDS